MHSISVIVPALNEENNIEPTVRTVEGTVRKYFSDWEILIFNDGSRDRTGELAESLAKENPKLKVFHHDSPKNLGGCYKRGVQLASKEYVIMVPGDNEIGADVMQKIFELTGSADIIIPYTANLEVRPLGRIIISRAYVHLMNLISGFRLCYYNGAVLHKTELVKSCNIQTDSFAYQAEALVKLLRKGYSYKEIGIQITYRSQGKSKALSFKNIWTVLKSMWQIFCETRIKRHS